MQLSAILRLLPASLLLAGLNLAPAQAAVVLDNSAGQTAPTRAGGSEIYQAPNKGPTPALISPKVFAFTTGTDLLRLTRLTVRLEAENRGSAPVNGEYPTYTPTSATTVDLLLYSISGVTGEPDRLLRSQSYSLSLGAQAYYDLDFSWVVNPGTTYALGLQAYSPDPLATILWSNLGSTGSNPFDAVWTAAHGFAYGATGTAAAASFYRGQNDSAWTRSAQDSSDNAFTLHAEQVPEAGLTSTVGLFLAAGFLLPLSPRRRR